MAFTTYCGPNLFPCYWCAGMGYEDYPRNQIPCRMPRHAEMHEENVKAVAQALELQRRDWKEIDGKCPYCKTFGPCKHWDGLGWKRDV